MCLCIQLYGALLDAATAETLNDSVSFFELVWARSLQAYIWLKSNPNQLCWLYKKITRPATVNGHSEGHPSFQQFLDKQQYSINGILRYERIFGKEFVSTGGLKTTKVRMKTFHMMYLLLWSLWMNLFWGMWVKFCCVNLSIVFIDVSLL